jgi:predicted DNA-binding WGR domain protein
VGLVFHVFGALAEFERSVIRERTKAGLDAARARGKKGGRPPALAAKDLAAAKAMLSDPEVTMEEVAKRLQVAPSTLYRHLPGGRPGRSSGDGVILTPVAYLEAKDASRNIRRAYSISYGNDLFGNWVVKTTYGRIGGKGRTIVTEVSNEDEALKQGQKALKRRQYAPKRIGVRYEVRAIS